VGRRGHEKKGFLSVGSRTLGEAGGNAGVTGKRRSMKGILFPHRRVKTPIGPKKNVGQKGGGGGANSGVYQRGIQKRIEKKSDLRKRKKIDISQEWVWQEGKKSLLGEKLLPKRERQEGGMCDRKRPIACSVGSQGTKRCNHQKKKKGG